MSTSVFSCISLHPLRCEIPANTSEQAQMNLLVTWIIDNPDAVLEEESRQDVSQPDTHVEEERQQQEATQTAAANEFLSLFGEVG